MTNAREIALNILYDIEYNGAYANIALKNAFLKNKDISALDKGFITRLVYGVVSMRLNLIYIISQNSKIKIKKISKYIILILMMGIYQIKYMDKIPFSASVNESVKLAKRYGHHASAGFVNGVLHSVIRTNTQYPNDKIQRASCQYSYPHNLLEKWEKDFGWDETLLLIKAMNEEPDVTLRVNTLKTTRDELLEKNDFFSSSPLYKDAIISKGFDLASSPLYKDGLVTAQDISAMLTSVVLNPQKNERILDICAAPGGKTTHIAQLMENQGEIVACDIYAHKTELIDKNAKRLGIDIINTVCIDSSIYQPTLDSSFDKVLADVPCSGYGIIRRKPDIKWKNEDADSLAELSTKILDNALKYVKVGGEVVFSTCTINKDENEERLFEILKKNPNFKTVDITDFLPNELKYPTAKDGYVTFYPHRDGIDGFFISKLKRCK